MNIRRILLVSSLCLLIGNSTSLAGERTEREMLYIAQKQLLGRGGAQTRSAQDDIRKLSEDTFYAIFGSDKGGFVVVSRDDAFEPVLGYSDSRFLADHIPCGMLWWLGAISQTMGSRTYRPAGTRTDYETVAPLCLTQWGQNDPYNFLTPVLEGRHTPTGCVATAMSQIMKFFAYPEKGKGKGYYTTTENPTRVTETINSTYQWELMQNTYDDNTLTDEIRMPVATLMKDAGLATNMTYGTNGSGALSVIAAHGFCYNFSYDSLAMHCYYREFFNQEDWMNTIYSELGAGRPLLYTGADPAYGGHAFVFDGIDADGKIHVNWGWDGVGDGYYDIADLNPRDGLGKPSNYHFLTDQSMVYGFKCQEKPDEDEKYMSNWCSYEPYKLTLDGKILFVESKDIYNFHFLYFNGDFGLFFQNVDGDASKNVFKKIRNTGGYIASFYGYNTLGSSMFLTDISEGNYRVYMASKAINEDECQPVRCPGGVLYHDLSITKDGVTISEAKYVGPSTPTSIGATTFRQTSDAVMYNLQGVRIEPSQARKGVYIQSGKKIVRR